MHLVGFDLIAISYIAPLVKLQLEYIYIYIYIFIYFRRIYLFLRKEKPTRTLIYNFILYSELIILNTNSVICTPFFVISCTYLSFTLLVSHLIVIFVQL
jgi:hypothetical protein